jgi:hypothetical protein
MNFPKLNPEVGSDSLGIRKDARSEMPQWLQKHLDEHDEHLHHQIRLHLSDNHLNEELYDKLRYDIAEAAHTELPTSLQHQLETPLPVEIPNGAQRYFGIFSEKVKHQIEALDAQETISDGLKARLDQQAALPQGYFSDLRQNIQHRVQYLETETPAWLDSALQSVAFMPTPEAYFSDFKGNVVDTIEAIEEIEMMEREEPTTIERLIQTPDSFTQLLDLVEQPPLPLGQELYFEDFSASVRKKVRGRSLDAQEKVKPMRILHPAAKWSIAACFAVVTVTGTTLLLPTSLKQSMGISPKTQKVQVEIEGKQIELNLQKQEAEKLSKLLKGK